MHIKNILTPQQIEFYLEFFNALDDAEGFNKATAETMADFDFKNLMFIEENIGKFKDILDILLEYRDEEVETEGTTVKAVVSELEDRWTCYDYGSSDFFRRYQLRSLGAWMALKDVAYQYGRDTAKDRDIDPNEWDPERRMF